MDYGRLKTKADILIRKYGQIMTLEHVAGTLDPVAGTVTSSTASYSCRGIKTNYAIKDIDGDMVQQGDMLVLLSATILPEPGDRLTIGGVIWKVVTANPVAPASTTIFYKVQIRR